jgi:hypothetical protein
MRPATCNVADATNSTITEYAPGGSTVVNTITNQLAGPTVMVFDSAGTFARTNTI